MEDYQDEFMDRISATEEEAQRDSSLIIQNKSLFKVPVPSSYVGLKWMDIVRDLLSLRPQVLALALYTSRYTKPLSEDDSPMDSSDKVVTPGDPRADFSPNVESRLDSSSPNTSMNLFDLPMVRVTKREPIGSETIGLSSVTESIVATLSANPDVEIKKFLDLELVVTNPLPTTKLVSGDEIIIMGNIVDLEALARRRRHKNLFKIIIVFEKNQRDS